MSQSVGVRQGNNMAPVLFLFLMSAFVKSLEVIWEENGLEMIDFKRPTEAEFDSGKGIIKSHKPSEYTSSKQEKHKIITVPVR